MQFTKLWIYAAAVAAAIACSQPLLAQYGPPPGFGPGYGPAGAYAPVGYQPPMPGGPMPGADAPAPLSPAAQPPASAYGCSDAMGPGVYGPACGPGCGPGCCDDCGGWAHRFNVFGEFLYLRPRDAEVAYGSIIDGPIVAGAPGLQDGRTGVLDYDYQPGFRLGLGFTLDGCNQIEVSYSQLDATSDDVLATQAPDVIRSLVFHPNSANAGANWLNANATGDLRFQLIDAAYRGLLSYCSDYEVAYLVGVRYARYEQAFGATFTNVGFERVRAGVDFDGVGMRFGLDAKRYGHNRQWFVYGKSYGSLIGGRFENSYLQDSNADPSVAQTTWEAGRVVTMLDLEAGLGWESCSGNIRLSVGYMYSGWFNTIRMNEWIHAVQNNDFVDTGMSTYDSGVTFDGLTARVELLW